MKPSSRYLAFLAISLGIQQISHAVDFYWDGNSTSANADGGAGTWDSGITSNWDTLNVGGLDIIWPSSSSGNDDAFFGGTAGAVTIAGGGVTANSLTFTTAGYTLSGGSITLDGTTPSIANDVATTINSSLLGSVGLVKSGAGTLTLGGASSYTGTTTIAAGTLALSGGNNRLATAGTVAFTANSTFDLGGNSQTLANLSISASAASTKGTITNGSLTLNGASALTISPGVTTAGRTAEIDATGLSSLTISKSGQTITVGGQAGAVTTGNYGTLKLSAVTNDITAATINVGTTGGANAAGVINKGELQLGAANTINADAWKLGTTRDGGIVQFQTGLTSPSVTLRGQNGTSAVNTILIGENSAGSTGVGTSHFNLAGGSVDILVNTLTISRGASGSTSPAVNGAFSMGGGTLTAGQIWLSRNESGGLNSNTSSFTQGGGTVKVTNLTFGQTTATGATLPVFNAQYTLNAGTLSAGAISSGTGVFATTSTRRINFNGGTITHFDGSTDLVINGVTGTGGSIGLVLGTSGSPTIQADAGRTVTLGAFTAVSGSGSLTKTGAGSLVLNSAAAYSGGTLINGGTISLGGADRLPTGTALSLADSAGVLLDLNNNNQTIGSLSGGGSNGGNVSLGSAVLTVGNASNTSFAGQLTGTGSLAKQGAGTLSLSGSNTYSGGTTVTAGALGLESLGALGTTGTITMNGGGLRFSSANTTDYSPRLLLVDGKAATFNTNGQNVTFASAFQMQTLSTASLVKTGSGTLAITPNTTASLAGINVSGGTLEVTAGTYTVTGSAGTGTPDGTTGFIVSRGATFRLNGGNINATGGSYVFTAGNTGGNGSNFILDSGTFDAGSREVLNAYGSSGTFTMNGGLFIGGEFRISQSAAGTVNLNGGTLRVANLKHSNNTEIVNFNGGTLQAKGNRADFITTGIDSVNIRSGGAVIDSNGFSITIPKDLTQDNTSAGGGLTKTGSGSLTLSGANNTYTGDTVVSAGTLVVNGNISTSAMTTVESGATLQGSGTVGNLTVDSGGFINPGNSPGILTVDGDYTQNGTLVVEIDGLTPGALHDQVNVDRTAGDGAVSISGSLTTLFSTFTPVNGDLIFILLNDGSDGISGTFTGLAQGATVTTYGGFDWKISYQADSTGGTFLGGNDIVLMAVPEPGAAFLGGLGMLCLLRRRR